MNSKLILNLARKIKINKILKPVREYLPDGLMRWVAENTDFKFKPLISINELEPEFKKACLFLNEKVGKLSMGDYLEFGVCHGTSMSCMNRVLKETGLTNVRLFGFDSFEGMPEAAAHEDEGTWQPGEFASDLHTTKAYLTKSGIDWNKTFLFKGWFSETLTDEVIQTHQIRKASLIMIDCDIYSSSKEALNFCAPLIKDQTIIFFDDWNSSNLAEKNMGEKLAFDEFLQENPELKAEEFGSYSFSSNPNGKIFLVTRN